MTGYGTGESKLEIGGGRRTIEGVSLKVYGTVRNAGVKRGVKNRLKG